MQSPDLRNKARLRAADTLKIAASAVDDDLLDFMTATNNDVLLQARAGSGKTTAIGLKVAFLTLDLGVIPDEIVVLTFNNAAARTLEQRMQSYGVPSGVRVRTFHAMAQRIVRSHFGNYRRCVFDERSADGVRIAELLQQSVDKHAAEKYYFFCASKMRTHYGKRKDYVQSVGRDALISAVQFLRTRGYGFANPYPDAWEDLGPIGGTAMKVINTFESALRAEGILDATGVLGAAAWALDKEIALGNRKESDAHGVSWVFIDEYQDVSSPYMKLVSLIRDLNGAVTIQGVGDDCQSINGFAGADLSYFFKPEQILSSPLKLKLLRNRRSGSAIVEWGNDVMHEGGHMSDAAIAHSSNGKGQVRYARASASRDMRYAATKIADLADLTTNSVAFIARRWKVGDHSLNAFVKAAAAHLKAKGYKGEVTAITAHGSKGLEFDEVFLLDDGSFPMSHPSRPILEALIPEDDYLREEACLKYVGGTRARQSLTVVDMT